MSPIPSRVSTRAEQRLRARCQWLCRVRSALTQKVNCLEAKKQFEGKRGPQPLAAHGAPDRLYGEIGRLKMEHKDFEFSRGTGLVGSSQATAVAVVKRVDWLLLLN